MHFCNVCHGPTQGALILKGYPLFLGVLPPNCPEAGLSFDLALHLCPACQHLVKEDNLPPEIQDIWYSQEQYAAPCPALSGIGAQPMLDFMAFLAPSLPQPGLVLEIGSFDGYLLSLFQAKGWQVRGCDPNPATAIARERFGIDARQEFFAAASYPVKTFDLVVARHLLEHIADPHALVEQICAVLTDTGLLALEVPNARHILALGEIGALHHEHVSHFTAKSLARLLERHGLRLLAVEDGDVLRALCGKVSAETNHAEMRPPEVHLAEVDLASMLKRYAARMDDVRATFARLRGQNARLAIFGASGHTTGLLSLMEPEDLPRVCAVFDNDPKKHGRRLGPFTVSAPARLAEFEFDVLVVSSYTYQSEILEQLLQYSGRDFDLITFYPVLRRYPAPGTKDENDTSS
jgi:novobiocin biosynthesis protein NovU/D-mycarose 3-C-methyltransferase